MIDVQFEHADGRIERIRKVSPVQNRRGAEGYERQLRAELLNPAPERKEVPILEEFSTRWLAHDAEATNRASTVREKRADLRLYIVPFLGRRSLDAIGSEDISAFYAHLRKANLSPKSVKNVGATLHRLLACAVEWDLVPKVPRFPKIRVADSPWDFFTKEETDRLLSFVTDAEERALLLFAFDTGARSGEQIAITWGDLDFHNRQVIFRRASSRGVVGPTKSGKERRVPMTARLAAALKAHRHLRGSLVFSQPNSQPLNAWRLTRALDRATKRAGLRQIRRHDCRHSFASQLVIAGVPLPQVQAWLGHSTITMTMRYAHLAPGHGADLIGVLEAPLRQPDGNRTQPVS
jgi:integrase